MNWQALRPAVVPVLSVLIALAGGSVAGTHRERIVSERRAEVVRIDCARRDSALVARADSLGRLVESYRLRESRWGSRRATASAAAPAKKERSAFSRAAGPVLGFLAGLIFGHVTGISEVSSVVSIVNQSRGDDHHGHHGKHHRPNKEPARKPHLYGR
jgi:hypothetical protein